MSVNTIENLMYKPIPTNPIDSTRCGWAVCYDCRGVNASTSVTAIFDFPHLAEDFIMKCLPEEHRERFYITHI